MERRRNGSPAPRTFAFAGGPRAPPRRPPRRPNNDSARLLRLAIRVAKKRADSRKPFRTKAIAPMHALAGFGVLWPRPPRPALLRYLQTRGPLDTAAAPLMQRKTHRHTSSRRNDLAQRLLVLLKRGNLLRPGERLGVAVSGGADSVALLRLLLELRQELGCVLCIVHFNHKLRGRASQGDEKFVSKLAAQHGLEIFMASEDIASKTKRERGKLEDVARRARYTFFERIVQERRLDRVAV